ncbi:MAG: hypothetical protein SGPRY_013464, partial [Prymnesium sp.]
AAGLELLTSHLPPESDASSPDMPILAAISSHAEALSQREGEAKRLEEEGRGGMRRGALKHCVEVMEVEMTDQLLQLTRMLDDCITADGRKAVKAVITRLRSVGLRLQKLLGNTGT